MPSVRATLTVIGPAYAGKTALIAQLVAATRAKPSETSGVVRLVDAGASDGDERHVAALVEAAAATDSALFVVDQDLRAPEVATVRQLVAEYLIDEIMKPRRHGIDLRIEPLNRNEGSIGRLAGRHLAAPHQRCEPKPVVARILGELAHRVPPVIVSGLELALRIPTPLAPRPLSA